MVVSVEQLREITAQCRDEHNTSRVNIGRDHPGQPSRPTNLNVTVFRDTLRPGQSTTRRFSVPKGA